MIILRELVLLLRQQVVLQILLQDLLTFCFLLKVVSVIS